MIEKILSVYTAEYGIQKIKTFLREFSLYLYSIESLIHTLFKGNLAMRAASKTKTQDTNNNLNDNESALEKQRRQARDRKNTETDKRKEEGTVRRSYWMNDSTIAIIEAYISNIYAKEMRAITKDDAVNDLIKIAASKDSNLPQPN